MCKVILCTDTFNLRYYVKRKISCGTVFKRDACVRYLQEQVVYFSYLNAISWL
jgi:hypothetical protein